jgi:pyridoxal phosphate-dependent aminotransferase EpsN
VKTSDSSDKLVSDNADLIAHARKLATQARDPAPHYEYSEMALDAHCVNG